jgi:penicillin-binding protein 1C
VHRRVAVDTRTGARACASTPTRYQRTEVFEFWPSDIQRLFALAGMPRRRPPDDQCGGQLAGVQDIAPVITSPRTGGTYQMRADNSPEALALNATAGAEVRTLYWFADGVFVGASRPSVALPWQPSHVGEFTISVVDDRGGSASRAVRVASLQ